MTPINGPQILIDVTLSSIRQNVMSSSYDRATVLPKLKITVPREPELATRLRAERSRILRTV